MRSSSRLRYLTHSIRGRANNSIGLLLGDGSISDVRYTENMKYIHHCCSEGECIRKKLDMVVLEELELAANAWHLARYVQEHQGKTIEYKGTTYIIDFPKAFDCGVFMHKAKNYVGLNDQERDQFMNSYRKLEKSTGIITARTLSATRRAENLGDYRKVPASRHFFDLLVVAILSAILATWLLQSDPEMKLLSSQIYFAFTTASLGASVYLLRITQLHLKLRSFEVERIPAHYIRLVLGVIAGGSIALIPELANWFDLGMGIGTLAFVLGYGVEIYYDGLEAVKESIRNALKRALGKS